MQLDDDEIVFGSEAVAFVEAELRGSLSGTEGEALLAELWTRYQREGKPNPLRQWLQENLPPLFPVVTDRPEWLESVPEWPYHGRRPMTFVTQADVGAFEVSPGKQVDAGRIFVFAIDTPYTTVSGRKDLWELVTKVVMQHGPID